MRWHNNRSEFMESQVYIIMKNKWGDSFPIRLNGRPYYAKWLLKAMEREQVHERMRQNQFIDI